MEGQGDLVQMLVDACRDADNAFGVTFLFSYIYIYRVSLDIVGPLPCIIVKQAFCSRFVSHETVALSSSVMHCVFQSS